jgi:hypothetical protein
MGTHTPDGNDNDFRIPTSSFSLEILCHPKAFPNVARPGFPLCPAWSQIQLLPPEFGSKMILIPIFGTFLFDAMAEKTVDVWKKAIGARPPVHYLVS